MREDILATRKAKKEELERAVGMVYPENTERSFSNIHALENFETLVKEEQIISLVGRVRSLRTMGKIAFVHIEDGSGKMQVFLAVDKLGEPAFRLFADTIEIGDFISSWRN